MAKKHYVKVCFSASGWVSQDIEVTDPNMTAEQMVEMLAAGNAFTTVHEGNDVLALPDFNTIGKVLYSETELEYFDFEAEDTYDLEDAPKVFGASRLALQAAVGEFVADTDDCDMSAKEMLAYIKRFGEYSPTGITIEERYASMTGEHLAQEIEYMARGLTNLMTIAHAAGAKGQELV